MQAQVPAAADQKVATASNLTLPFIFLANAAWLDFVNTKVAVSEEQIDLLDSAEALKRWLVLSGLIGSDESVQLDASDFQAALKFRAQLHVIADRLSRKIALSHDEIAPLIAMLSMLRVTLQFDGSKWRQVISSDGDGFTSYLAQLALNASETVSSTDSDLVRHCEGRNCALYFLDTSKNHKRRWCSMETCGNRHKAAEHYHRAVGKTPAL